MAKANQHLIKDTRAQLTVIGLLLLYLTLLVLSALMPNIISTVGNVAANLTAGGYTSEAAIIRLFPMFLIIVLLATVAMYGTPWR